MQILTFQIQGSWTYSSRTSVLISGFIFANYAHRESMMESAEYGYFSW